MLATGSLKSRTGLDLMQDKGFSVIADKLNNLRFLSHFRSIHRGAYFA
jgi:DNA-directed RNA polymerase I subunit RPA2